MGEVAISDSKINKKRGPRAIHLTVLPIYLTALLFVVGPLVYMLALSFMARDPSWGVQGAFTLENYTNIFQPVYLRTFGQSVQLALMSTALMVLIGYPFGYFMARLKPNLRRLASFLLIVPLWTSSLMRLYGWIIVFRTNGTLDSMLMGLGIASGPLRLLYTYPAVVVGMVYVLVPFMIYSVYSSAEKLDMNLVEAARDLGASRFQAFWTVSLKLTLPGLLSGVILTFIPSMGLFFIADILGGNKVVLVGSVIQEQLLRTRNWPFAAALAVILMLMTTVFMFLYRKITNVKELEGLL